MTQKRSASDILFYEYREYIIRQLIKNHYAPSYATVETMGRWYSDIPFKT